MGTSTPLTILLTLRGRHLHTLRWMWHANRIRLPFHVVIADGEVNPVIANVMDNPSNFSDLSYEYHRYEDRSFSDYYRKCLNAISKVKTPYVMISDNDDFLMPSGIFKSLDFLDRNPDYVCHGGQVGFFSINSGNLLMPPNVLGSFKTIGTEMQTYCTNHGSATKRVCYTAMKFIQTYYNVHRTPQLNLIFDERVALDPSDLVVDEWLISHLAMTLGKAGMSPGYFSYFRQIGTSLLFGSEMDTVDRFFSAGFMSDFQSMVATVANWAAKADGKDKVEVEKLLRGAYADAFRSKYINHLRKHPFKAILRSLAPGWLQLRVRRLVLIARLKQTGASQDYLHSLNSELRQVEETLEGSAFLDFVHSTVGKDLSPLY